LRVLGVSARYSEEFSSIGLYRFGNMNESLLLNYEIHEIYAYENNTHGRCTP
jgi:hypothetical protein